MSAGFVGFGALGQFALGEVGVTEFTVTISATGSGSVSVLKSAGLNILGTGSSAVSVLTDTVYGIVVSVAALGTVSVLRSVGKIVSTTSAGTVTVLAVARLRRFFYGTIIT
jgi:hypothetical protein